MASAAATILGGTSVGKSVLGFETASSQKKQIRNLEVQNRIAANQESIKRTEKLRKILGAQNAQAAASGISAGSASLFAIQAASFNEFAQDQELANLELDLENENLQIKKRQVTGLAVINAFDNLFEAAAFSKGLGPSATKTFNIFGN